MINTMLEDDILRYEEGDGISDVAAKTFHSPNATAYAGGAGLGITGEGRSKMAAAVDLGSD